MSTYLTFIGVANVLGTVLLLGALSARFSDRLLRRWTYILPPDVPFTHSPYSHLWLWWAIIGTAFIGALNVIAAGWPVEFARVIVIGDVCVYFAFEALAIAGTFSPRYGKGILVAHFLWTGQGAWGVFALLS